MREMTRFYVGGEWVEPLGSDTLEVIEAATEEPLGHCRVGIPGDVDRAVAAARRAFEPWAATPGAERAAFLAKVSRGIRERRQEIAEAVTREVGTPISMSLAVQADLASAGTASYARLAGELPFEEEVGHSLVVREPIGVVGAITPWNFPLVQAMVKVSAALAAGCTVVLKPSEVAPSSAFILAEIAEEAGLPAGVLNVVAGTGPVAGEALAAHPDVDMVSITGSTRAGRRVAELAAANVKRVTQELGGKSANVLLDDADLDRAVAVGVQTCFLNAGQTCSAWTRMLVPEHLHDEVAERAGAIAESFAPGDPMAPETRLGPLASEAQRERVRGYVRTALEQGTRLVTGGPEAPEGLPRGYYFKPTVFAGVDNASPLGREEVFGPVLALIPFRDDDDAVRLANDSPYGLAGAVWSAGQDRAVAVARRLRTGQVTINGAAFNLLAPFGGYKQSGNGREGGRWGLEEFLEVKALQLPQGGPK